MCILGLATGSSPITIYSELVRLHKEENLVTTGAKAFPYYHCVDQNFFSSLLQAGNGGMLSWSGYMLQKTCRQPQ